MHDRHLNACLKNVDHYAQEDIAAQGGFHDRGDVE